jgi:hypothetical protein
MRRSLAVAALLAVAGAASAAPQERRYRDPKFGWSLARLPGLRLTVVDARPGMRYHLNGATVASFVGARTDGKFDRFPPSGVAFGFFHREGGPAPDVEGPEARFPLSRRGFGRSVSRQPAALVFYRHVVANGNEFNAYVWIGPRSSKTARASIWRVVRSLRFPPLRTGSFTGYGFYVLDKTRRYPLRSVTRHSLDDPIEGLVPFYLVHAPGGFYTLSWPENLDRGYKNCDVQLDRPQLEFFCRENGARWNRVGRVLVNPNPTKYQNDPLELARGKVAHDGHVLANLSFGDPATPAVERKYWPRGR